MTPRRYAVVGDPIRHSLSPLLHRRFNRLTQRDGVYCAYRVDGENFADFARRFFADGGDGLNITVPHKKRAADIAARKSALVQRIGVANVLATANGEIVAYNTDGAGLVADITRNLKIPIVNRSVLLLGAGGAAAAIAHAVADASPAEIVIVNRTTARAQQLAKNIAHPKTSATNFDDCRRSFDIIINATAAGLSGVAPPVAPLVFAKTILAYDIAYGKAAIPFLQTAKNATTKKDGIGMLIEQAKLSYAIWENLATDG